MPTRDRARDYDRTMPPTTPTAPAPSTQKRQLPSLPDGLLDDPRRVVALVLLAAGVGLIVGFKLAGGVEKAQGTDTAGTYHPADQPCPGCRERDLQRARMEAARHQVVGAKLDRDARAPAEPPQPPPPATSGVLPDGSTFSHARPAPVKPPIVINLPPE